MRDRFLFQQGFKCTQRARRGFAIARLAGEMPEPVQRKRRDAVAGWRRVVAAALGAIQQLLVIVADEKESAVLAVFELVEQHVRERARPLEISRAKIVLHELDQRVEQKRVIVEIGV